MGFPERILLIIATAITGTSALFCVISLATSNWTNTGLGLFCSGCSTSSTGLSIVAFILLVIASIILFLLIIKRFSTIIQIVSFVSLFLGTIFTLATHAAYFHSVTGYSYRLMVVSHFLCYVATILVACWMGSAHPEFIQK